jgi:hypothetical protein
VLLRVPDAATAVYDWYGTPHCWNAIADGMFRWSKHEDEFYRNVIVAGLEDPYYRELCGSEYEQVACGMIGTFRRAFTMSEPTELALRVFDFGMKYPLFREIWHAATVAEAFTDYGPVVRHVAGVGRLTLDYIELVPAGDRRFVMRVLSPRDGDTRAMLPALAALGTPRPFTR